MMARRRGKFNPSQHPRDSNGRFKKKGGSDSSPGKALASTRGSSRANVRARSSAPTAPSKRPTTTSKPRNYKRGASAALNSARTPIAAIPASRSSGGSKALELARDSDVAVSGVGIALDTRAAFGAGAGAVGAAASGNYLIAAALGARAGLTGASALNEVHAIRTRTSRKYKNGTVQERSKFEAGYEKRAQIINTAATATDILGAASLLGSTIKGRRARRGSRRVRYTSNGVGPIRPTQYTTSGVKRGTLTIVGKKVA